MRGLVEPARLITGVRSCASARMCSHDVWTIPNAPAPPVRLPSHSPQGSGPLVTSQSAPSVDRVVQPGGIAPEPKPCDSAPLYPGAAHAWRSAVRPKFCTTLLPPPAGAAARETSWSSVA